MKQLTIIVKPFVASAVLAVVQQYEVWACVVDEVKGYGRQKGYLEKYRGSEYSLAFLPKVEISIWVADEHAEPLTAAVVQAARTGRMGDGKIFITETAWPQPLEF